MDNRYLIIFSVITFVLSLSIISVILFKQLQKYKIMKNDIVLGLNISKVLINLTNNILSEYGFNEEKVKILSIAVLKSIDYIVANMDSSDLSEDIKVDKAIAMVKCLLTELNIVLSVDEENVVRDVVRIGISVTNNEGK